MQSGNIGINGGLLRKRLGKSSEQKIKKKWLYLKMKQQHFLCNFSGTLDVHNTDLKK